MSVKTIFKVLIGTVVAIAIGSLLTELFNINITASELKQVSRMATEQSASLFTQETYRNLSSVTSRAGAVSMDDLLTEDNTVYVTGAFYGNLSNSTDIWKSMYSSSNSSFKQFCDVLEGNEVVIGSGNNAIVYKFEDAGNIDFKDYSFSNPGGAPTRTIKNIYKNVGQLYTGLYEQSYVNSNIGLEFNWSDISTYNSLSDANKTIHKSKVVARNFVTGAKQMTDEYYTPSNLGIPYFDPVVINKMFRWHLTMLLTNSLSTSIQKDENDNYFVNYRGFRCYTNNARISELDYKVYNMNNNNDRNEIANLIGVNADALRKRNGENGYITIVEMKYSIPITYQGITPLRRIFNYVWESEVQGTGRIDESGGEIWGNDSVAARTYRPDQQQYNYDIQNMSNGSGDGSILAASGEVYYAIIR